MGDGAYDKEKVRKQLCKDNIRQVIPPQHNAVTDKKKRLHMAQRDEAIEAHKINRGKGMENKRRVSPP
jgi:hypothetical protein